jgi:hypothetical protein
VPGKGDQMRGYEILLGRMGGDSIAWLGNPSGGGGGCLKRRACVRHDNKVFSVRGVAEPAFMRMVSGGVRGRLALSSSIVPSGLGGSRIVG